MTASSVLLILVGIFVIVNAPNLVGVLQGNKKFNLDLGTTQQTIQEVVGANTSTTTSVRSTSASSA